MSGRGYGEVSYLPDSEVMGTWLTEVLGVRQSSGKCVWGKVFGMGGGSGSGGWVMFAGGSDGIGGCLMAWNVVGWAGPLSGWLDAAPSLINSSLNDYDDNDDDDDDELKRR